MFVDYFDNESAIAAATGLNGIKDPGTSLLRISASLPPSTIEAIRKLRARIEPVPESKRFKLDQPVLSVAPVSRTSRKTDSAFKYIKPRSGGDEICLIDVSALVHS